jgi:hypothetical protein
MRDWWQHHVAEPLDRLPVNWDMWFLYAWMLYFVGVVLSGGRAV